MVPWPADPETSPEGCARRETRFDHKADAPHQAFDCQSFAPHRHPMPAPLERLDVLV
jgi:hypothetical protein